MSLDDKVWIDSERGENVVKREMASARHKRKVQEAYDSLKKSRENVRFLAGMCVTGGCVSSGVTTYQAVREYSQVTVPQSQDEINLRDGLFTAAAYLIPVVFGVMLWRKATRKYISDVEKIQANARLNSSD